MKQLSARGRGHARTLFGLSLLLAPLACGGSAASPVDGSGAAGTTTGAGAAGTSGTAGAGAAGTSGTAGAGAAGTSGTAGTGAAGTTGAAGAGAAGTSGTAGTGTGPVDGPPAGNPNGHCAIPTEAALEDSSHPTTVVGTGTPASCTGAAFVAAVAKGGVITFDCGPNPVTITLTATAKIVNDAAAKTVIDGGNKVTLSGGGKVRILYQDTCDQAQHFTTPHCQDQETPALVVQNLTFVDGNSKGQTFDGGGGGAIFVRGGRFKAVSSRFFRNVCEDTGPDIGGAAIRTLSQSMGKPVYIVGCTFGGAANLANVCSNGGGLSSIGVSYTVVNSLFSYNRAIGHGANPARAGTPGGGSGGAIYNDGNTFTLSLCGTAINNNSANEGGGAIFFVSNDRSGSLVITDSTLTANPSGEFETAGYPGIFVLAKGNPTVTNSPITK